MHKVADPNAQFIPRATQLTSSDTTSQNLAANKEASRGKRRAGYLGPLTLRLRICCSGTRHLAISDNGQLTANLVAALATLDVDNLTHLACRELN